MEKSEKIKYKIEKLNKMTPKSSFREDYEEKYYTSRKNDFIMPVIQTETAIIETRYLDLNEEHKVESLENINNLSKRINSKLQSILQRHGK